VSKALSLKDLNLRVLAVDDEPANLRVFEQIFEAFGAKVTAVGGGREALALLEFDPFDVLLVDIHMPGVTGLELMRLLRTSSFPSCEAPAIAVTADVYSYRRSDYLRLGFDDFLSKPVPVVGLVETVRRLAASSRRERTSSPSPHWAAQELGAV
jgi:CheY-like chemotaxis protein